MLIGLRVLVVDVGSVFKYCCAADMAELNSVVGFVLGVDVDNVGIRFADVMLAIDEALLCSLRNVINRTHKKMKINNVESLK